MIYNIQARIDRLLENDQAKATIEQIVPGIGRILQMSPQASRLSLEQVVKYTRMPGAEEKLQKLEEALQALNTPENAISPSERRLIERFQAIAAEDAAKTAKPASHHQDAISPGQPWLDTKGERIQAHGGAVYYEDGVYYWYGENKEHTDGQNGIWTWGIKAYASKDLCNWEDKGFLIPPVLDDPNSGLFPTRYVDRPHLLKCAKTGKYVCWIKLSGVEACFSIWQADSLLGPYTLVEDFYRPFDHAIGDFDLVNDEDIGTAYGYFDCDHRAVITMRLSEDYLRAEEEVTESYPDLHPPFTREAPALFACGGKKYMFTSGMTGYVPNKSDSAVSDAWDQPFVSIGNPHIDDASDASFNSQISKVFKVEGKENCFIAMADRWLPEIPVDKRLADVFTRAIAMTYDPQHYQATDEEKREMMEKNLLESANTSIADYVWLPVKWEDGKPVLRWHDSWKL